MENRARVVPLFLLLVLFSLVAALPGRAATDSPSTPPGWLVECVDCPAGIELLGDHALRLDAAGNPHIAYGGEHLYYAHHDGAEWHFEIVDPTDGVGEEASLALDAAGAPHIVYDAPGTRELRYAWHDGASWHVEVVDGGIWFGGGGLSLALDANGSAHASYYDWFHRTLKHAWREGATWHVEVVDGTGGAIGSTSLALDAGGAPHISYALGDYPAPGQFSVRYARYDGAAWHLETVYTGPNWGMETSLALDGAGLAHILLTQEKDYEGEDGAVYYARRDGSAWQLETVATGDVAVPALALDDAGEPHVAFEQGFWELSGLRYGWREGGVWHVDSVPDPARVGRSISLALDPAGRPHLAYLDEPGSPVRHVKHAWHDGAQWHTEYVDYGGSRGGGLSLAVDGTGRPHIAYRDKFQRFLMYARLEGSEWATEYVDTSARAEEPSMALDATGEPHIAYHFGTDTVGGVRHAWHGAAGWQVETVDGEGWGGNGPSLAFDPLGDPYISYGDDGGKLRLAWHDGSDWQVETVWAGGEGVGATELAFDPAGRPHIVYATSQYSYTLRYAWHDGSAWQFEIILPAGRRFAEVRGLAIDPTGRRHLLYGEEGVPWYAWCDGAEWNREQLEGYAASLTLDAGNRPHLSYTDQLGVYHAWHDGAAWRVERAASTPFFGESAIDVDEAGVPHIAFSYYTLLGDRLLYARRESPLFYVAKDAQPGDGVENGEAITYTLALYGPGHEVELWDPLPANVEYISGTLTAPAEYSPTARAVLWHGVLPTDTAQVIYLGVTAVFSDTGPAPIVNTAWLTDMQTGAVSTATAVINSHRVYLPVMVRNYWCDW